MYFVSYTEKVYDDEIEEYVDEEKTMMFDTLDEAKSFMENVYYPSSGFRFMRLWKAEEVFFKANTDIQILE